MTIYIAGFTSYDIRRDPDDHWAEPALPENPDGVHATPEGYRGRPRQPEFLDRWGYKTSLCGRLIKVLLPLEFDPGDPDACQRCAGAALRGDFPPVDPRYRDDEREQQLQDEWDDARMADDDEPEPSP